ncbi:hypothetical protein PP176A_0870 [Sporanaerobacter sp. PP17-6a]|nr:hypothetical protein PP176A_0870 [Sporanaerobacter sp. PP17-6a]
MDSRYINFNYTEFLETIYSISMNNILYIHGDRRDKKAQLVLGHGHNTEEVFEEWYQSNKKRKEFQPMLRGRKGRFYRNDNPVYLGYFLEDESKGNWKSQMRYDAIDNTVGIIEGYYDDSAKKTEEVLARNQEYFKSLGNIKDIVVIGHSLSEVDYHYFKKIINRNEDRSKMKWHISWHSIDGLKKIIEFSSVMDIDDTNIEVFKV